MSTTTTIPSTSSNPPPPPTTTTTTATLDSRIWRHLPLPLVDRVLSFLPPPALFRSLTLSKRFFLSLPSSPLHHLLPSSSSSPLHPSFLFFPNNPSLPLPPYLFLFSPVSSTWHRLPLPSFLPPLSLPSASSSGLLLFLSSSPGPKSLFLLNPLSRLASRLPGPTSRPRLLPSAALSVPSPSSLAVLLAGDDMVSPFAVKNLSSETLILDGGPFFSADVSPLPRLCSMDPAGRMVFSRGKFYCMSSSPFGVLVYDVGANSWGKVVQAPMRRFLRSPSLVEVGPGRVVMVAAVEKRKLQVPKSVRVWEMVVEEEEVAGKVRWAEVEKMPEEFYRQFEEAEGGKGFECVGSGEYVAVTIKGSTDVVVFDYRRKEWRWAPHCRFVERGGGGDGGGGLRGLGYEPRLATPVLGLVDSVVSNLAFHNQ